MNLFGQKVCHKNPNLGVGIIIEQSDIQIKVQFESRTITMQFPEAFAEYITLEDPKRQEKILTELKHKKEVKAQAEAKQRAEAEYIRRQQNTVAKFKSVQKSEYPCIAFKLTYCDGGRDDENIGFCGICSPKMRALNIKKKRAWCTAQDSICKKYFNGTISKDELDYSWKDEYGGVYPCYDSIALRDWSVASPPGQRIVSGKSGHLCILTTQLPNEDHTDVDKERVIVGLFIIGSIEPDKLDNDRIYSVDNNDYKLSFTLEEAKQFKYWDIADVSTNPNKLWGSGLIRNLDDDMAIKFLEKAIEIKTDVMGEKQAREFLRYYCEINGLTSEKI